MGRKKTVKKGEWKPVRIKTAWLSGLRAACKREKNRHALPFDPDTASDPTMLEFACDIAAWVASGEFNNLLKPEMAKAHLDAATLVAAYFGAKIVTNEDGSLSVIESGKDHTVTVPACDPGPIKFQRQMFIN